MVFITGKSQHPAWKYLKFFLLACLLLGITALYLYLNPDLWRKWFAGTPLGPLPTITKTYKWRNADGEWQISDRPPKGNVEYETLIYNSDANIVPSLEVPESEQK